MVDPEDFISPDEGYRDTDWDSHLRPEAFYTEALPCESCGRPVDGERKRAEWDSDLLVGPCCAVPDVPFCSTIRPDLEHCTSVEAVAAAMEAHVQTCATCGPKGNQILEIPTRPEEKRAA